ncbi:MAG: hypothetical protein RM022_017265 [Nostoc sp. EfeVER01]|uniref:hypothetical protein n=1 Tax=unclassified Nostoc TaxID=2593658 RepID=UPI002AD4C3B6|nr:MULTISPECIES: hypothetical protein [unclassified Nostoc]MDZ7947524.1 hypothetical protein [Nostoc sp. EfeVER01]MDZ7995983.1 hypothetical protein [Nostoc sp. EspVER01]
MERFEYNILVCQGQPGTLGGVNWFLASNLNQSLGFDSLMILNRLGNEGWEVVALGDIGFSPRPDIILKRRIG